QIAPISVDRARGRNAHDKTQHQWQNLRRRGRARDAAPVGHPGADRVDRNQVRLWHRPVRRLLGPYRRRGGALLLDPCRRSAVGSAAAGGGLALGFNLPNGMTSARAQNVATSGAEINAWVMIKPDDTCEIRIARSEMGQGTRTGLAQLVAEELGCDWNKVTTES